MANSEEFYVPFILWVAETAAIVYQKCRRRKRKRNEQERMFEKNVYRCGAVDVADDSGLVRRGMIRDLVPSQGLIIDFGYSDHHADLTPFTQCTIPPRKDPFYNGDSVETLFRCSVNEPWCWYPSKLLAGSWDTYAFVEVSVDRQIFHEVLPVERVRRPDHSVLSGDEEYQKHSVGLWIPVPLRAFFFNNQKFLEKWSRATGTVGVTVTEQGKLEYISMGTEPLTGVEIYFRIAIRGTKRNAVGEVLPVNAKQDRSALESAVEPQKPVTVEELCSINKYLPREILRAVFGFLHVDTLVQCSQVCSYWKSVLHSPWTSFHVQIDLSKCGIQKLASMLHRMVTASTVLVLTNSKDHDAWDSFPFGSVVRGFPFRPVLQETRPSFPIRTVMDMLKAMGIRVPKIVITRWHVWADELLDTSGEVVRIRSEWKQICSKLVLKKMFVYGLVESWRAQYRDVTVGFDVNREGRLVLPVEKGIVNLDGVLGTGGLLGLLGASQTRRNQPRT